MNSADIKPREEFERREAGLLQEKATKSTDPKFTRRMYPLKKDAYRTDFHRDYTRILHSRAFRRLRHKTQVFISPKNDHLCTRMEHSLHVASVASTIARALRLNEDLVAAIAVGHDLGHPPFGHKGERSLKHVAEKHSLDFAHELHSLRVVDWLESPYKKHPGLNLTFAVRDGIACHHGEGFERELKPDVGKRYNALDTMSRGQARPATLEGCVVRWADKIAYLGRDLEDALILHLPVKDVPSEVRETLGTTNREIINSLVSELVQNGTEDGSLRVSARVHKALNAFYKFNMKHIYHTKQAKMSFDQIDRAMEALFEFLLEQLEQNGADGMKQAPEKCLKVFAEFLSDDIKEWKVAKKPQLVLDFIAGMTDDFFISSFTELFLPTGTDY